LLHDYTGFSSTLPELTVHNNTVAVMENLSICKWYLHFPLTRLDETSL